MAYIGKTPSSGIRNRFIYTATAGQTTFSGTDDHSRTLSYTDAEFTDVFLNGVKLDKSDYTATSGTSIVLDEGAAVDDTLEVLAFDTFSVFSGEFSQDVTVGGTLDANGNVDVAGDTTVTGDLTVDTNTLYVDSTNNRVGIGTSSPSTAYSSPAIHIHSPSVNGAMLHLTDTSTGATSTDGMSIFQYSTDGYIHMRENGSLRTYVNGSERMRLDSSGIAMFGTTDTDPADNSTAAGLSIGQVTGRLLASVTSAETAEFNRGGSDGTVIIIRNSGSYVGSISVSGGTTSYNAFSGSHWGRLADNSKPTILRGTVIETIGTMINWYQVEFDVDIDGEIVTKRRNITKPANVEDGDTFDYVVSDDDATPSVPAGTYTGTLRLEDDEKHVHVKVSDTSESKAVYGVFGSWDNDDDTVNDMYVAAVGTGIVRINSGETVAIGDLLDSNGDGTAKVQSDDLIRSRTIGKVLSTVKQETYDDGSYTVPCALYCG